MPIYQSVFTFKDDLEGRIKNICHDPVPKDSIRRIQCEENQGIGMIHPGARFNGYQSSNNSVGGSVGMSLESDAGRSGYLTIKNLTTVISHLILI